jgi:CRP-like cAMP-binding protein
MESPWSDVEERALQPGEVLLREGDTTDSVFQVVEGTLEVLRGPELRRIDVVGPGATLGEIAALAGTTRRATIRALEPAVVREIDAASYGRWLASDEERQTQLTALARTRLDRHVAITMITDLLGVDESVAAAAVDAASWVRVDAGEVVFREGDPPDSGYLVVSGRFAASRGGDAHP